MALASQLKPEFWPRIYAKTVSIPLRLVNLAARPEPRKSGGSWSRGSRGGGRPRPKFCCLMLRDATILKRPLTPLYVLERQLFAIGLPIQRASIKAPREPSFARWLTRSTA